jgi:hypothetical protein
MDKTPLHAISGGVSRHSGLMVLESKASHPYTVLLRIARFPNNRIAKIHD